MCEILGQTPQFVPRKHQADAPTYRHALPSTSLVWHVTYVSL